MLRHACGFKLADDGEDPRLAGPTGPPEYPPHVCYTELTPRRNEHFAASSAEALTRPKAEAPELARLRREVKRLEQENEILKRAAAFFAREAAVS